MTDDEFDRRWRAAAGFRQVSAQLRPFVRAVVETADRLPADALKVHSSLEMLLEFLTGEGRTDANCAVTDAFFSSLERDTGDAWAGLPAPLADVLRDLGGALHDSVHAPRIAETFESLPEQLLARLRRTRD